MQQLTTREVNEFALLRRRVMEYERTWFALPTEPQASLLRERPDVYEELVRRALEGERIDTHDAYTDDTSWIDPREELHRTLLDGQAAPDPDVEVPGLCYFLLGKPGSGKTTSLKALALRHAAKVASSAIGSSVQTVDADSLRVGVPEYEGGLGSGVVQREVVHMTYGDSRTCVVEGAQTRFLGTAPGRAIAMYDTIGDRKYLPGMVEAMRDRGWEVHVLCTKCPTDIAVLRATKRALEDGRFVDPAIIRDVNERPRIALSTVKENVDGWALVDTSGDSREEVFIADGDGTFGAAGDHPFSRP